MCCLHFFLLLPGDFLCRTVKTQIVPRTLYPPLPVPLFLPFLSTRLFIIYPFAFNVRFAPLSVHSILLLLLSLRLPFTQAEVTQKTSLILFGLFPIPYNTPPLPSSQPPTPFLKTCRDAVTQPPKEHISIDASSPNVIRFHPRAVHLAPPAIMNEKKARACTNQLVQIGTTFGSFSVILAGFCRGVPCSSVPRRGSPFPTPVSAVDVRSFLLTLSPPFFS